MRCISRQRRFAALLTLVLGACGGGDNNAAEPSGDLHACDLLPAAELGRIAGQAVSASNVDVENNAGANAVSQCTHTFEGSGKRLTVQIRRSGKPIGESRQADAESASARDDGTGYNKQIGDAIAAGEDIAGLGSLAYLYEVDDTLHLVTYWDDHYSLWLWTRSSPGDRDSVLQLEKAVAQYVIDQL